jgi:hypothetical protein
MGKNPSFQFYPKDWRADAVFSCSLAARGLWLEMMNMMHASARYGYLSQHGLPIPDETISRYCGCTLQEYQTLLAELDNASVPRRTSDGIIYSKRMVDDEKMRMKWRKNKQNQRVAGSPKNVHPTVQQMSSSSPSPPPSPIQSQNHRFAPYFSRKEQETASERGVGGGVVVEEHCPKSKAVDILEVIAEAKRRGIAADEVMKERRAARR